MTKFLGTLTVPVLPILPTVGSTGQLVEVGGTVYRRVGNTWVKNIGDKGDTGATGPAGPQGPPGVDGVNGVNGTPGAPGATGPVGPIGPVGPTGPVGPAGPVGGTGPIGSMGPIGLTGPQGQQGVQGPIGLTGPQGPIGLTGPVGPAGPILPDDVTLRMRRHMQVLKNPGATTVMNVGFASSPTYSNSGGRYYASADDATGAWLTLGTSSSNGNVTSITASGSVARPGWNAEVISYIRVDLTSISNVRYWSGWAGDDPSASATPAAGLAAFRYSSNVDTGGTWRAVTSADNSSVQTVTNTGVPVNIGGRYVLRVVMSANDVTFFIDGVQVAQHTTNLPAADLQMGWMNYVTTLTAARRSLLWSRTAVMHD